MATNYRSRWLVAYWMAALLNMGFFLSALLDGEVSAVASFSVLLGAVSTTAGASMATHLARLGLSDVAFDEATAPMRVIVTAWALLVSVTVATVVVGTDFGARPSAGVEAIASVVAFSEGLTAQLFGVASLFVIVGDSFSKYRRLLSARPQGHVARSPAHMPWQRRNHPG